MEEQAQETTETTAQQMTWPEAAADAEANRVNRETVTDVIDVMLTDADLAEIARANANDDLERQTHLENVEALKEDLKEEKTAISAIEARIRDRNNSVRKGTVSKNGEWILEEVFATNTVRYLDPRTERVVLERPMSFAERQTELPLADASAAAPEEVEPGPALTGDEASAVTNLALLLEAAQRGEEIPLENEDLDESSAELEEENDDAEVEA